MKKLLAVFVLAIAALAFAVSPALAQKRGRTKAPKAKSYDFSGDTIDGDLVKPDGEFIDSRRFASHASLIKVRRDFIREILKSAEDL